MVRVVATALYLYNQEVALPGHLTVKINENKVAERATKNIKKNGSEFPTVVSFIGFDPYVTHFYITQFKT